MNAQWKQWLHDSTEHIAKRLAHAEKKRAEGDMRTAQRHAESAERMTQENAEVLRRLATMSDADQATAAQHALGNEYAPCLNMPEYWDGSLTY